MRMSKDWKVLQDIEIDLSDIVDELCKLNEHLAKAEKAIERMTASVTADRIQEIAEAVTSFLDGFTVEGKNNE